MELGLLVDFRSDASAGVKILLTPDGLNLYNALLPLLNKIDMTFKEGGKAEISRKIAAQPDDRKDAAVRIL